MSDLSLTINVTPRTWLVVPFALYLVSAALYWNVDLEATPDDQQYVGAHNAANFYVLSPLLLIAPGAFAAITGNKCYSMLSYVSVGASLALFAGLIDTEGAYASYSLGAVNAYRINVEADPSSTNIKFFVGGLFFYLAWFATFFLFSIRVFDRPMKANPSMDIKTSLNTVAVACAGLISIAALWSTDIAANPADANYANVFVFIAAVLGITLSTVSASLHGSAFFSNVALYSFGLYGWSLLQNLFQVDAAWAGAVDDSDLARVKTGLGFGWGAAVLAAIAALRAAPAVNTGVAPSYWKKLNIVVFILLVTAAGLLYNTVAERLNGEQFSPLGHAGNFYVTTFFLSAFGFCVQHATSDRFAFFKPLWWTSVGLCHALVLGWNSVATHSADLADLDLTVGGLNLLRARSDAAPDDDLTKQSLAGGILVYIALPLAFINTFQSREEWVRGRTPKGGKKPFFLSMIAIPVFLLISVVVLLTSGDAAIPAAYPTSAVSLFSVPVDPYYVAFYPVHVLFLISFAATFGFFCGSSRTLKIGLVASAYGAYLFANLLVISGPGSGVCAEAVHNEEAGSDEADVECQTLKAGYVFAFFAIITYIYTALMFLEGDNEFVNAAEVVEADADADADVDANASRISDV
jgi:hypothetical protein